MDCPTQLHERKWQPDDLFWELRRTDIEKEFDSLQAKMREESKGDMNLEIQTKMHSKYDITEALRCLQWIYEVTGLYLPEGGFWVALRDGYLLSQLLITLHPPFGKGWKPRPIEHSKQQAFRARAQITEFLKRAKEFGVSELTLSVDSLYEAADLPQVLNVIRALNREACKKEWSGPKLALEISDLSSDVIGRRWASGRYPTIGAFSEDAPNALPRSNSIELEKRLGVKRLSISGFDIGATIIKLGATDFDEKDQSDRATNVKYRRANNQNMFRPNDKCEFLLMNSREFQFEWVPGTVLKVARKARCVSPGPGRLTVGSRLSARAPRTTQYAVRALDPKVYDIEPDETVTIQSGYVRKPINRDFQMISFQRNREPVNNNERKRVLLMQELIKTEATYLQGLNDIVNKYYGRLFQENDRVLPESYKGAIMYKDLETFLTLHKRIFISMKETRSIPGCINANADWLKMYTMYSGNFEKMAAEIRTLRKNRLVSKRWARIEKEVGSNIESLLITPIQRVPRYQLLLEQMIKYTSNKHPQRITLEYAKEKVTEIAQHINDAKERIEKTRILMEVLATITDVPEDVKLVQNNRFFIKEELFKRKSTSMYYTVKPCRLMLFTDILLWTEKSGKFRKLIPLYTLLEVNKITRDNLKEDGRFGLQIVVEGEKENVEVFAATEELRIEWQMLILVQQEHATLGALPSLNYATSEPIGGRGTSCTL